jgi:PAS domain S-box-containing protein
MTTPRRPDTALPLLLVAEADVAALPLAALAQAGLTAVSSSHFPAETAGYAAVLAQPHLLPPPLYPLPVVALVAAPGDLPDVDGGPLDYVRLTETDPAALRIALRSAQQRFELTASSARSAAESAARFHNTVTISHDGVLVLSPQGVILFSNEAALNLFERDTLTGEVFGFPVSNGGITELEIPRRSGGIAIAEMRVADSQWEGQPAHLASLRDITARKQAEAALRLNARAIEASTVGVIVTDANLPGQPIIYVNPAFEAITGYSAAEVLGRNCRFLQGSDRDQAALDEIRAAMRDARETLVTLRNYRRDGQMFWNELRIAPITDADGQLTHFVGLQNDITRRVEAEQAVSRYAEDLEQRVSLRTAELNQQKQRLETILDSISDMVALVNADGDLIEVNQAFRAWLGASGLPHEQRLHRVTLPDDHALLDSTLRRVLAGGQPVRAELTLQNPAGRVTVVDGAFSPIHLGTEAEPEIVCSLRDVSLQKQLEDGLRQALQRERELSELKTRFSALVSHEFRTPLAVILSSVGILKTYHDRLNDEQRLLHLQKAETQIFRLTQLMNDVLVINSADAVGVEFRPTTHDLAALCTSIVNDATEGSSDDKARVRFSVEGACAQGYVDETLLRHIIFNLLSNALKYSPPRSPVTVRLACADEQAVIRVADQGIGIPQDSQPLLLHTFHRAPNARTVPGTGLGLVIVKRAVDAHRGAISFESAEDAGTTFTVTLPIRPRL